MEYEGILRVVCADEIHEDIARSGGILGLKAVDLVLGGRDWDVRVGTLQEMVSEVDIALGTMGFAYRKSSYEEIIGSGTSSSIVQQSQIQITSYKLSPDRSVAKVMAIVDAGKWPSPV